MGRGSPRPRPLVTRQQVVRAAAAGAIPTEEIDRAHVLGQVAELLLAHPRLERNLAYKGGAIMHLVDGSPRRSNDLDAHAATAGLIKAEWLKAALSTNEARKVVFGAPREFRKSGDSITILGLDCRAPSGKGKIQLTVNITWRSPLCLMPAMMDIKTATGLVITIPVMHQTERCAEKLDAFLFRDEVNDSYDLYFYGPRIERGHWKDVLPEIMRVKLAHDDRAADGLNVVELFETRLSAAEVTWAQGSASLNVKPVPSWEEVQIQLRRYRAMLPEGLDKTHRRPVFQKKKA